MQRICRKFMLERLEERVLLVCSGARDEFTVGLTDCDSRAYEGYTLLTPNRSDQTFLLDIHGRVVHAWDDAPYPGKRGAYLGENGSLYSTGTVANPAQDAGGFTGALYIQNWDGDVVWQFEYATEDYTLHHDLEIMPNGNILAFAWTRHTADEMIALGRDPARIPDGEMWGERILELRPTGEDTAEIVWQWNLIDHVVQDYDPTKSNFATIAAHPEKLDINLGGSSADWVHLNTIDYHPRLDQIVVSSPTLDEIWVIDHSTTTSEAASSRGGRYGQGGDFLYRWGNPRNYRAPGPQQLFNQHDIQWIDDGNPGAGNLLVFNNQATPHSQVYEIEPPVDESGHYTLISGAPFGPAAPVWIGDTGIEARFISGTQRLPNGNTLFINGPDGVIGELSPASDVVWQYVNPVNGRDIYPQALESPDADVFKARRYPADFAGFVGGDLTPKGYVEYWIPGDYNVDGRVTDADTVLFDNGIESGDLIFDLNFDNVLDKLDVETMKALVETWRAAPTAITSSPSTVAPRAPAETLVARLTTASPDVNTAFQYQLVVGSGDSGNRRFRIEGDQLLTAFAFDFGEQTTVSIRVRVTDTAGRSLEQVLDFTMAESPWRNPTTVADVNGDGVVSPKDALLVVNEITDRLLSDPVSGYLPNPDSPPDEMWDVNGDWIVAPLDALLIINQLESNNLRQPMDAGPGFSHKPPADVADEDDGDDAQ